MDNDDGSLLRRLRTVSLAVRDDTSYRAKGEPFSLDDISRGNITHNVRMSALRLDHTRLKNKPLVQKYNKYLNF